MAWQQMRTMHGCRMVEAHSLTRLTSQVWTPVISSVVCALGMILLILGQRWTSSVCEHDASTSASAFARGEQSLARCSYSSSAEVQRLERCACLLVHPAAQESQCLFLPPCCTPSAAGRPSLPSWRTLCKFGIVAWPKAMSKLHLASCCISLAISM